MKKTTLKTFKRITAMSLAVCMIVYGRLCNKKNVIDIGVKMVLTPNH